MKHVLFHCPLFTAARRRHLTVSGRPQSFPQLLEDRERDQMLLRFLEETRACTVGRVGPGMRQRVFLFCGGVTPAATYIRPPLNTTFLLP